MKLWALMFLLLSTQFAFSQEEDCEEDGSSKLVAAVMKQAKAEEAGNCPDKKKFKNLCMMIGSQTADDEGSKLKYKYQRKILEGSCVDIEKDSAQVRSEKVKKAWAKLEKELVCNNLQFDVQNGNIIKYAVSTNFDRFIDDAIEWKVNLNKVDESDQKTVLDYIKSQIERTKGSAVSKKLQSYYDRLKKAGAKHKSEL